jgi:hypothetical protein
VSGGRQTPDPVRALANTVLYEGYVLYPYGARADRNRMRFQWGVLGPPGAEADGAAEGPDARTEVVVDGDAASQITVTVRFLQIQQRTVEHPAATGFREVDELSVDGRLVLPWDEAVEREVALGPLTVGQLLGRPVTHPVECPGRERLEELHDAAGDHVGRIRRRRWPLHAEIRVAADVTDLDGRLWCLRVEIVNRAAWSPGGSRETALRRSLVATHVVLGVSGGVLVSAQDPPAHAREAVGACRSHRLWPVLVGEPGSHDTVLAAPIILYDHPALAPESPGDLFDATEIDELLTLRVMTLTDEEKREARATDPRAAAIVDRSDDLPPEVFQRLHGAIRELRPRLVGDGAEREGTPAPRPGPDGPPTAEDRSVPWWDPGEDASVSPETDAVEVDGVVVAKGSRVRLAPRRRADAQDLFTAGRTARVAAVVFDVDGGTHLAVTVDDDPASELHDWYGRYLYFAPDEVEPLDL